MSAQDEASIRELITRQFDALNWDASHEPDLSPIPAGFLPNATLFAPERPAEAHSPQDF